MLISTHLPPPVMTESTASVALVTHMLCWSWAMCFSAAASSENDQGSMNLASNTAPDPSTMPSSVAAIHRAREGEGRAEGLDAGGRQGSDRARHPGAPVEIRGGELRPPGG